MKNLTIYMLQLQSSIDIALYQHEMIETEIKDKEGEKEGVSVIYLLRKEIND